MIWGTITEVQDISTSIPNIMFLGRQPISVVTYNCGGEIIKAAILQCQGDEVGKKILLAVNQHNTNVALRTDLEEPIKNNKFYLYLAVILYIFILSHAALLCFLNNILAIFFILLMFVLTAYFFSIPSLIAFAEKLCLRNYERNKTIDMPAVYNRYYINPFEDLTATKTNRQFLFFCIIAFIVLLLILLVYLFFIY